jgi:hypothetical protein
MARGEKTKERRLKDREEEGRVLEDMTGRRGWRRGKRRGCKRERLDESNKEQKGGGRIVLSLDQRNYRGMAPTDC